MDGMSSIKDILVERNIILKVADALSTKGFTQVPNHLLESNRVSPGAKLAYAMLLKYAWQNNYCFPGQDRLARDMGSGKRSVVRYMQELEKAGYVTIRRRGLGKSNLYELSLSITDKNGDKS